MIINTKKYVDIPMFLTKNPYTKDFNVITDSHSIKLCIKNLIMTRPGERQFNSSIGTHIDRLPFINIYDAEKMIEIRNQLYTALNFQDSRITNLNININKKTKAVDVSFFERGSANKIELNIQVG